MTNYTVTHEFCALRKRKVWVARKNGSWFGIVEPKTEAAAWDICALDATGG